MNSILQCLSHTKPLLEYCLTGEYRAEINKSNSCMKGALISAYAKLMESVSKGCELISPYEFKSQIARFANRFVGYSQQDAQEFLVYLLEGLHEDLNRVNGKQTVMCVEDADSLDQLSPSVKANELWKRYLERENSKVVDTFVGHLRSTLTCRKCGFASSSFEPFLDLSLPIPSKTNSEITLQECLRLYTQEEVLEDDDRPVCGRCKVRQTCTKTITIQKFPQILILHLKRFSQGPSQWAKLQTHIKCPLRTLDMSRFAAESNNASVVYNLFAVSNHTGTPMNGHYTACARNPYSGEWNLFNDSRVSSVSEARVVTPDAYILFYELAETTTSRL